MGTKLNIVSFTSLDGKNNFKRGLDSLALSINRELKKVPLISDYKKWETGIEYKKNQIVANEEDLYICTSDHTSSDFSTDSSNWSQTPSSKKRLSIKPSYFGESKTAANEFSNELNRVFKNIKGKNLHIPPPVDEDEGLMGRKLSTSIREEFSKLKINK
jgi:hypothetical protein